ncbi:hypothetical protein [Enterovirga aerilata]|uniref:Uncharacterized protein n=1 Tax=Enterovirga aerilata TaxID=2730920 RepID=A0A849IAI4_9HYPH|nr:hypothetical protein [Enterovirga sp. DB1703]NNM74408.1 hypothetical protein [Enterovirga sp. DB1703]
MNELRPGTGPDGFPRQAENRDGKMELGRSSWTVELVLSGMALILPALAFLAVALVFYPPAARAMAPVALGLTSVGIGLVLIGMVVRPR